MTSSNGKSKKKPKIKEFELSEEFQSKYGIIQIYIQGKSLVFQTYEGKFVWSRYYDDDIVKTIDNVEKQFKSSVNIRGDFIDNPNLITEFLQEFAQMLNRRIIQDSKEGLGEEEDDDRSLPEKLIDIVSENASIFFKDEYDTPYARVYNQDHHELIRIGSDKFKRYVSKLYYQIEGKVPNSESIISAVSVLQAKAEYDGQTIPLSLRVAWQNDDNEIYYDLTNDKWQYVKITKEGWEVVDDNSDIAAKPIFKRFSQTPQVIPVREYEPDVFDKFLDLTNVKREEDKILLAVHIITLFIPNIPHVALQLHGHQGSAKSMLQRYVKRLVDPSKPELLSIHKDRMEFIQQISHNHLVFYDNLKYVPSWLSGEVCSAITGSGGSKRAIYTVDDDFTYEYKRCFGFNGINLVLTDPDALDRSIVIELSRIDSKHRKPEILILKEFDALRPRLLGYVFDILVKALNIKPTIELKEFPRMADSVLWGEAIARAMGYPEMKFVEVYNDNTGRQNVEAIESTPIGQVVSRFINNGMMNEEGYWCGFTSDFLKELNVLACENNIDINSKSWPKSVNSLSRRLKVIASNIREGLGYDISIVRETTGKNKGASFIEIRSISSLSSLSSPEQTTLKIGPQNPQNGETEEHDSGSVIQSEDTLASDMQSEDTLSRPQISSPDGHENRAQNEGSEDSEGSEDIYRVSPEHEPEKYQDLILTETLPDIGQYFTCKDHPDVWNKDLKGLIISHFIPEHPLGEVAQDQNQ